MEASLVSRVASGLSQFPLYIAGQNWDSLEASELTFIYPIRRLNFILVRPFMVI